MIYQSETSRKLNKRIYEMIELLEPIQESLCELTWDEIELVNSLLEIFRTYVQAQEDIQDNIKDLHKLKDKREK